MDKEIEEAKCKDGTKIMRKNKTKNVRSERKTRED
jgi:hypothetical protein